VDADQVLAFRLDRSGLAVRRARGLAEAAACPASDFARDAALLALAARAKDVSREAYDRAPGDFALYGRALIARDDGQLGAQLGRQGSASRRREGVRAERGARGGGDGHE
jgi:hypothetical protein